MFIFAKMRNVEKKRRVYNILYLKRRKNAQAKMKFKGIAVACEI